MNEVRVIPVMQGNTYSTSEENVILTTILGSCVAACLWDPVARVGGLNHFLLPGNGSSNQGGMRYGVNAMEILINSLIREGADRSRIQAKILGGAKMYAGALDIGKQNSDFAKWFLDNEGFDVVDTCVGGNVGRNVRFWPTTGRVQRRFLEETVAVQENLEPTLHRVEPTPAGKGPSGDVDLF